MNEPTADSEDLPPERRSFIRHPADVPLQIERADDRAEERVDGVSYGGLSFFSRTAYAPGTPLRLRIEQFRPAFDALARVAWCREEGNGHRIGVTFDDPEVAFQSRLVEQICAIEQYREELGRRLGRSVSRNEAARLWVEQYAAGFPDP